MHHIYPPSTGMGNNGNLTELRRNLRWWQQRPAMAGKRRDERIASLKKEIAALEQEQTK